MAWLGKVGKVFKGSEGAAGLFQGLGRVGKGAEVGSDLKGLGRVGKGVEGASDLFKGLGRVGKESEGGSDLLKTKNLESEVKGLNTRLGKIEKTIEDELKGLKGGKGESGFFSKWGKRGLYGGAIVGFFTGINSYFSTDDPSTGDCHSINLICQVESFWHKFKIVIIIVAVILLILFGLWLKSALFDKKEVVKQQPQTFVAPGNSSENGDGNVLSVTQGGGGKNDLDKYMYCLILLLGIGIHYLYENYEQKITQYTELIDKEKDDQKR